MVQVLPCLKKIIYEKKKKKRERQIEEKRMSKERESELTNSTWIKGNITGTPPSHGFSPRLNHGHWKDEAFAIHLCSMLNKDNKKSYMLGGGQGHIEA